MDHVLVWVVLTGIAYAMYLVAYVFESRVPWRDVPVWRGQSKAFLPGDMGLALFIAVCSIVSPTLLTGIVGAAVGICAFFAVRKFTYSKEDYTKQQWRSPSKLYHDFVICGVFGFLVAVWGFPFYTSSWSEDTALKILGVVGLLVWIAGVIWDEVHDEVPNNHQHPTRYWPIWRKPAAGPVL